MRSINKIHKAVSSPIADLITYRALPTPSINHIDPFLFLNHHGYQVYHPHNSGLPFGPHPHRGFETVTIILKGDLMHKDSSGAESIIRSGGVQWMTAGKGLIHSEVSSEEFKQTGGELELLQLWVNLPAKLKMVEPTYEGKQKNDIPSLLINEDKVEINLISGKWEGKESAFSTLTDISLASFNLQKGGEHSLLISTDRNIFFYVVKGSVEINNKNALMHELVEFNNDDSELNFKALEESFLIIGHAKPFNEPIVAQGPFVMNTQEEIMQAYEDYRNGDFD